MEDVTATMAAGQAKVRGIESVAEGAAHVSPRYPRRSSSWSRPPREYGHRPGESRHHHAAAGQASRCTRARPRGGAEQVTAAAEQQGASTQEMAAAASSLLEAAERLRALVRGFRV